MVGQNANRSRDAELDETFVDGVHPAAKPGRGACTCLVRSARAARPRRCRTGPPARVPDASGESLMPFVCETAHTSIGGSERRLGPRLAPPKALDTDSRYRTRHRPIRLTLEERAPTGSPASSSNESSDVQGSIDPARLQSYLEGPFLLHRRSSRKETPC